VNQPGERKRAVGYVRVSSAEQALGLSLESQEQKIREWCDFKGYELIEMFREEQSAYTDNIAKRPAFRSLLERLPELRADVVVVFSLDRWARSLVVATQSFSRMAELGID